jgi:hypothetical protein
MQHSGPREFKIANKTALDAVLLLPRSAEDQAFERREKHFLMLGGSAVRAADSTKGLNFAASTI